MKEAWGGGKICLSMQSEENFMTLVDKAIDTKPNST